MVKSPLSALPLIFSILGASTSCSPAEPGPEPTPTPLLQRPDAYASADGVLHIRVRAKETQGTINGQRYNGMFVYETSLVDGKGTYTEGDASSYVGPEWRLNPGDRLIVDYINELPPYEFTGVNPTTGDDEKKMEYDQPINLHTHGLTVSPAGNADNVLLSIPPNRSNQYIIDIPAAQHQGLYWYHPHIHGLTDDQVYGGLAGHIVMGRADGNYKEFNDIDIVPMMIRYNVQKPGTGKLGDGRIVDDKLVDASAYDVHGTALVRDGGDMIYTVNGISGPRVRLNAADPATGLAPESQIWALSNITGSASYILALEEIDVEKAAEPDAVGAPLDFVIVSVDGSPLPKPVVLKQGEDKTKGSYHLPQGGRVAILVQGASDPTKSVRLMQLQNRSGSGPTSAYNWPKRVPGGGWRNYTRDILVQGYNDFSAPTRHVDPPETLTPNDSVAMPSIAGLPVGHERTFTFDSVAPATPETPNEFPINGGLFPESPVAQPRAGIVEEWTIENLSSLTHPFHFHTQYGQVMDIVAPKSPAVDPGDTPEQSLLKQPYDTLQYVTDMEALSPAAFTQDVVGLPPAEIAADGDPAAPLNPGKIVMRLLFLDYLGTYVEHCHRLPHEDRGMMSMVRTIPKEPIVAVTQMGSNNGVSAVRVLRSSDASSLATITPFPGFAGALTTAVGDVDGDAVPDVAVASGPGRTTGVVVYSGASMYTKPIFAGEIAPFGAETNGASLALGDLNGDHKDDIVVGEGSGGASQVVVYDGASGAVLSPLFQPYDPSFTGGVNVAAGMVEEGGRVSFFTAPGPGMASEVHMYNIDIFGDANGVFPDLHKDLKPIRVTTFTQEPASYTGGLSITTGYPFAMKGGFASVITSTLSGATTLTAYTVARAPDPEHPHSHVSASGVHRAVAYLPGAPRKASLVTSLPATKLPSGSIVGAFSTLDGAVLVTVPPQGGAATRWIAETKDGKLLFKDGGPFGAEGSYVSGM